MCALENNGQIETKFGRDDAVRTKIPDVSVDHVTWPTEAIQFPVWSNRKSSLKLPVKMICKKSLMITKA